MGEHFLSPIFVPPLKSVRCCVVCVSVTFDFRSLQIWRFVYLEFHFFALNPQMVPPPYFLSVFPHWIVCVREREREREHFIGGVCGGGCDTMHHAPDSTHTIPYDHITIVDTWVQIWFPEWLMIKSIILRINCHQRFLVYFPFTLFPLLSFAFTRFAIRSNECFLSLTLLISN